LNRQVNLLQLILANNGAGSRSNFHAVKNHVRTIFSKLRVLAKVRKFLFLSRDSQLTGLPNRSGE
jgi:hypothetical protein